VDRLAAEAEDSTTVLQAWDFTAGDNVVVRLRDTLEHADRTMVVLPAAYPASRYATDEWTGAFLHDPTGRQRLLPVRVEACGLPRLLATLVYVDPAGTTRETARTRPLEGVRRGRRRPEREPGFPGEAARAMAGGSRRFRGSSPG
jgi:TIR domain